MRKDMRALKNYFAVIAFALCGLFSPLLARAQGADDPARLRAEIEHSEDGAAASVLHDVDDLVKNTESAMKNELKKDEHELGAQRAKSTAVAVVATAVPDLDDSNISIERDIESLEAQSHALDSIK